MVSWCTHCLSSIYIYLCGVRAFIRMGDLLAWFEAVHAKVQFQYNNLRPETVYPDPATTTEQDGEGDAAAAGGGGAAPAGDASNNDDDDDAEGKADDDAAKKAE